MTMDKPTAHQFALQSRILHWLMAAMLLTMLFIGVAMVSSLGNYHKLVALHRPLGITIFMLAIIRIINRKFSTLPPFPPTMSRLERTAATASERMLYALMFVLPIVGWGMLSAGHYPIVMFGPVHLPSILPANPALYAFLRKTHTILAYLLFFTFLAPPRGGYYSTRSSFATAPESHGDMAGRPAQRKKRARSKIRQATVSRIAFCPLPRERPSFPWRVWSRSQPCRLRAPCR